MDQVTLQEERLVLAFRAPDDPEAFERYWETQLWPQLRRLPGWVRAERWEVLDTAGRRMAQPYMEVVLAFPDAATLSAALASPEGTAAGRMLSELPEGALRVRVLRGGVIPATSAIDERERRSGQS